MADLLPWRTSRRLRQTIAQPAAGADWSFTLPPGNWYLLLLARWAFTASAAAANRNLGLDVTDGSAVIYTCGGGGSHTANGVVACSASQFGPSISRFIANTLEQIALPNVPLPAGYVIRSRSLNLQGGDQHSAVELLIAELAASG